MIGNKPKLTGDQFTNQLPFETNSTLVMVHSVHWQSLPPLRMCKVLDAPVLGIRFGQHSQLFEDFIANPVDGKHTSCGEGVLDCRSGLALAEKGPMSF